MDLLIRLQMEQHAAAMQAGQVFCVICPSAKTEFVTVQFVIAIHSTPALSANVSSTVLEMLNFRGIRSSDNTNDSIYGTHDDPYSHNNATASYSSVYFS